MNGMSVAFTPDGNNAYINLDNGPIQIVPLDQGTGMGCARTAHTADTCIRKREIFPASYCQDAVAHEREVIQELSLTHNLPLPVAKISAEYRRGPPLSVIFLGVDRVLLYRSNPMALNFDPTAVNALTTLIQNVQRVQQRIAIVLVGNGWGDTVTRIRDRLEHPCFSHLIIDTIPEQSQITAWLKNHQALNIESFIDLSGRDQQIRRSLSSSETAAAFDALTTSAAALPQKLQTLSLS